jgi:hypothetical protein
VASIDERFVTKLVFDAEQQLRNHIPTIWQFDVEFVTLIS